MDSLNGNIPILAFVDEILKGTNTIERISASASVLKYVGRTNAIERISASASILKYVNTTNARILVATHDIELTQMIETGYDNYHFREVITDTNVLFDYKLKYGPSTTRNAIKLLKVMDFKSNILNDANYIYDSFIKSEKWPKLWFILSLFKRLTILLLILYIEK